MHNLIVDLAKVRAGVMDESDRKNKTNDAT